MATDVLREFGRPREVASRYAPQQDYLIGPTLFPVYRTVLKLTVAVCAAAALAMMLLGQYRDPGQPPSLDILARAIGGFLQGTLFSAGIQTLVFALIERAVKRGGTGPAGWDPSRLPPVNDRDRISYLGRVLLLYWIAAIAIVLNFFPEWIAVAFVNDSGAHVFPILEPAFRRYLPFLDVAWIASFALGLLVLRRGRWTRTTRWVELAIDVLNVGIVTAIILGPPVFRPDALVKLVLRVALIALVVGTGSDLLRLLRPRSPQPWEGARAS